MAYRYLIIDPITDTICGFTDDDPGSSFTQALIARGYLLQETKQP